MRSSIFLIRLAVTILVVTSLGEMVQAHKREAHIFLARRDYVLVACFLILDLLAIPVVGIILVMLWTNIVVL